MLKSSGVFIIVYILITSLSGLTGLLPVVHAAITDLTSPITRHSPPEHITRGEKMMIIAIVEDEGEISSVNLWYRAPGKRAYNKIRMDQIDSKTYKTSIEVTKDFKEGIEYYIEAIDQSGNEGTDGNKTMPYFVEMREAPLIPTLKSTPEPEARITRRPWFKSPWFWVGVLAVAGGAVAVGSGGGGGDNGTGTIIVK